jgi:hypothetical protein
MAHRTPIYPDINTWSSYFIDMYFLCETHSVNQLNEDCKMLHDTRKN